MFLLKPKEKQRGALVLGMVIVMAALLETAGVASVMPFLSVLGNPETVQTNPALAWAYESLGFDSVDGFLFALGAGAFGVIIFSAVFHTLTHYAMKRFIEMRRHSISDRLLETYLRHPYSFFLDRQSGDMAESILLSTVQGYDKVVLLEKGRISASGTFEGLTRQNKSFQSMATAEGT
ncbi:hypothetical protein [Desulfonatronospira sp.]|uniref:hypothetical protein n=1 Tax=Desulfonatronospira sp. TaxID=1962951 RepID=UPI0025C19848|nr:hypothetical protein [Desulfonatronospira sp.]